MIKMISQNGDIAQGTKDFVCDSSDDISNLPLNCNMGSTCLVIDTSEVYILDSKKEWKKIGAEKNDDDIVVEDSISSIKDVLETLVDIGGEF